VFKETHHAEAQREKNEYDAQKQCVHLCRSPLDVFTCSESSRERAKIALKRPACALKKYQERGRLPLASRNSIELQPENRATESNRRHVGRACAAGTKDAENCRERASVNEVVDTRGCQWRYFDRA
jgi:hypothetical protein